MSYFSNVISSNKPVDQRDFSDKQIIESYQQTTIYRNKKGDYEYYVQTPTYKGEERKTIETIIEIVSKILNFNQQFASKEEKNASYYRQIIEIIKSTPELNIPPKAIEFYAKNVLQEVVGFGILEPLLADDKLEEIMVIGLDKPVFVVHRNYGIMITNVVFAQDKDIRNIIDKIGAEVGRRIDFGAPLLDARLRDGTRVNATIPPISLDGSTLTLRKFRKDPFTVVDMINKNTINTDIAAFLWLVCEGKRSYPGNVLISGGTASGKTTTLNMMASFIPQGERIISIEDTAELALSLTHWIRLETRPPGVESTGEIDMNTLLKNVMRMRPDRIIVGEIRGEEGFTMFSAMNTGHRGAFGTVHANTARETLIRLANPPINVPLIMLSSLNFILIQHRVNDKRKGMIRRMTEVAELIPNEKEVPSVENIYEWDPVTDSFSTMKKIPLFYQQLSKYTGLSIDQIKEEHKKRIAFLDDLKRKNFTGIEQVTQAINSYYG